MNFSKSKLFGIGVNQLEVSNFSSILGCQASKFPTLGLPIGTNMHKYSNWIPIIDKFQEKLSNWKSKTLSVGGRLTLIKSILNSLGTYYFSLFNAPLNILKKLETIKSFFFFFF